MFDRLRHEALSSRETDSNGQLRSASAEENSKNCSRQAVMIHIEANVERLSQIALREEECGPTSQAKANRKAASQGKDRWSPPVAQGVAERGSAQHRQRA